MSQHRIKTSHLVLPKFTCFALNTPRSILGAVSQKCGTSSRCFDFFACFDTDFRLTEVLLVIHPCISQHLDLITALPLVCFSSLS